MLCMHMCEYVHMYVQSSVCEARDQWKVSSLYPSLICEAGSLTDAVRLPDPGNHFCLSP